MAAEDHAIRRDSMLATVVTIVAFAGAYWLLPGFVDMPTAPGDRMALAAICWAAPGFVLLVAIMMVSTARRFSPADIGGQASGPPSPRLAIKAAFLQNTLEQTVLAGAFFLALAAVAGGPWLSLLPVAALLFVVGRVLFYRGYHRGAQGRSLGMALTMMPICLSWSWVSWRSCRRDGLHCRWLARSGERRKPPARRLPTPAAGRRARLEGH
jgi:uncharacterized membrane protein YecN with MAPEG domain